MSAKRSTPMAWSTRSRGGAIQATSWTLKEAVGFSHDEVTSCSWESYPILRFSEVPAVAVEIVPRPDLPPLGAGEAAQGPVAAALANAVHAALGCPGQADADHARPHHCGNGVAKCPRLEYPRRWRGPGPRQGAEAEFDGHGYEIDGSFGAVGAMRAKLAAGHRTDLVILTSAIVRGARR